MLTKSIQLSEKLFFKITLIFYKISDIFGMGMLDRYKKKGGFVQLLVLIETSSKQKQDQFLNLIAQENSAWEQILKSKILSIEHILKWPPNVLVEIFTRVQPLTLAAAFHGDTQEKIDQTFSCMSNTDKRKLLLMMSELNPTPAEKSSCLVKLLGEVRGLINQNIIKLEKFDTDLYIPEGIEEKIQNMGSEIKHQDEDPAETLVFPDDSSVHSSASADPASHTHSNKEEVDSLKKKVNLVLHENTALKHEVQVLKNKLEQIRKIA